MKKLFKISVWLLLVLIVLLVGLVVISKLLEDKIIDKSVRVINNQLNVPVNVKSIEFSLIKQFPNATLQLNEVLLLSDNKFNAKHFNEPYADTLIYIKELYLSVNILALINNKLDITKAHGKRGQLNFLVDKNGIENFKVLNQKPIREAPDSSRNDLVFMLNQIQLKQVKIRFINKYKNTGLVLVAPNYTVKGQFYKEDYSASSKGKLLLYSFEQGKLKLQPSAPASVLANLAVNNNVIKIENGSIQTNSYKINTKGLVRLSNPIYLDLKLSGSTNKLDQLIKDANVKVNKQFEAGGNLGISAAIKGIISNTESPAIAANFRIEEGIYNYDNIQLSNINIDGSFSNGVRRSAETSSIKIESFNLKNGSSTLSGSASLSNFNYPYFNTSAESTIDLHDLQSLFEYSNRINYAGKLKGNFKVSGYYKANEDWKLNLVNMNKSGELQLMNAALKLQNPDFHIEQLSANARFNNSNLIISNIKSSVQSSEIKGEVTFINYINTIIDSTFPVQIQSNLSADIIRYSDYEKLFDKDTDSDNREYNIYCDFKSDNAVFKKLEFSAASGKLKYFNKTLDVSELKFHTQGGDVGGDIKYWSVSNERYRLQTHANTSSVNIKSLFQAFNNFNQEHLKAENLNGHLTSDFELEMDFDNSKLDTSSIEMLGHFKIEDGELNNFIPISEAARFSDIEELKHIEFSKLENDILITNSTIYIPDMEIASNAFDMEIYGHQKFSGDYIYHFKINMSDFLGGKSKRLAKQQSEFGYIEDDGYGKKTLYLVATSTNNESKVKLDKSALKDNFKNKRKQEKKEFKQALREEFGLFKKDTTLKKEIENDDKTDFIIEWDEE